MKKYWHIVLMLFCVLLTAPSCSNDDDDVKIDEEWKQQNEEAFKAKATDSEFKKIESEGKEASVYYKVLKTGTGKQPLYTSTVNVYYKGKLIDGTVFDQKLFEDGSPFNTLVAGRTILGWTVALQHMHVGDKWEVWIPQELGYGTTGSGEIPGYSTLVFEMELVEITAL